jgi:hypothetical protein
MFISSFAFLFQQRNEKDLAKLGTIAAKLKGFAACWHKA